MWGMYFFGLVKELRAHKVFANNEKQLWPPSNVRGSWQNPLLCASTVAFCCWFFENVGTLAADWRIGA
jgi:hypothetical protein